MKLFLNTYKMSSLEFNVIPFAKKYNADPTLKTKIQEGVSEALYIHKVELAALLKSYQEVTDYLANAFELTKTHTYIKNFLFDEHSKTSGVANDMQKQIHSTRMEYMTLKTKALRNKDITDYIQFFIKMVLLITLASFSHYNAVSFYGLKLNNKQYMIVLAIIGIITVVYSLYKFSIYMKRVYVPNQFKPESKE